VARDGDQERRAPILRGPRVVGALPVIACPLALFIFEVLLFWCDEIECR